MVVPRGIGREMVQALVLGVHAIRICARSRRDRLEALALGVAENTERVRRKRRTPLRAAEDLTDAIEVRAQPLLGSGVHELPHALLDHADDRGATFPPPT